MAVVKQCGRALLQDSSELQRSDSDFVKGIYAVHAGKGDSCELYMTRSSPLCIFLRNNLGYFRVDVDRLAASGTIDDILCYPLDVGLYRQILEIKRAYTSARTL